MLVMLAAVFSSCSKEHAPTTTQPAKTYNVSLKVGFAENITGYNAVKTTNAVKTDASTPVADTLAKYVTVLNYHVYDSNMHEIRNGSQQSTDADFGNISYQLASGTYTVIVDAGTTGFSDNAVISIGYPAVIYPALAYNYADSNRTSQEWQEYPPFKGNTFYKEMSITVSSSAQSFPVSLDRIVGRLEVVIQDAIPANAKSLTVYVNGDAQALQLVNLTPEYQGNYFYNILPVSGYTNTTVYAIIANTQTSFPVEIKSTDSPIGDTSRFTKFNVLGDKLIPAVTCKANETTVLTGKLYDGTGQGFTITYDPTWDTGSPTTIHF
jgi:hypothetical protein